MVSCTQTPPEPPVPLAVFPPALLLPPVVPALVEPPVVVLLDPAVLELPPVEVEAPLLGVGFGLLLLDEQATASRITAPARLEAKTEKRICVVFMLLHLTIAVVADFLSGIGGTRS